MSRQLQASVSRRGRRAPRRDPVVVDDMDIDDPQPSTSTAPSSALAAPAAVPVAVAGGLSLSADNIAGDEEWLYDSDFGRVSESDDDDDEDMDFDPANATLPTSEDDEELDYVAQHRVPAPAPVPDPALDTSMESIDDDESLANVLLQRNAPGSSRWRWFRGEAVVRKHAFAGYPGLQQGLLCDDPTPKDFFFLFFTPALWTTMKEETNRYAVDWAARHPRAESSHMKAWVDVTEEELQCYLALRILMGIVKLPEVKNYWSTDPLLRQPTFPANMSRDRFAQITSKLHFKDNDLPHQGDPLFKIRPVVDTLLRTFKDVYVPHQTISIDESLFR